MRWDSGDIIEAIVEAIPVVAGVGFAASCGWFAWEAWPRPESFMLGFLALMGTHHAWVFGSGALATFHGRRRHNAAIARGSELERMER